MTRQQVEAGPTARTDAVPVPSAAPRRAVGAVILAAALVGAAMLWGLWLRRDGVDLHLSGGQPLTGRYDWRLPIAALAPTVAGVAAMWLLPVAARRLGWAWLLAGSAAVASTWAVMLAATDGASALASPLAMPFEYLRDIGRVGEVGPFLDSFTAHVPEGAPDFHWTTHVGGHPPGALLAFVGLDRLGLGGAGWAAALCVAAGASAVPAVLITVRTLGGDEAARRAAPFVAVSPLALWVATSADALFCGVAAWGVCCLAVAAGTTGAGHDVLAFGGGVVLGASLFLSYGLALMAVLAVAIVVVRQRVRPLVVGAFGVSVVVARFAAQGYWWWDGLGDATRACARARRGRNGRRRTSWSPTSPPSRSRSDRRSLPGSPRSPVESGHGSAAPSGCRSCFPSRRRCRRSAIASNLSKGEVERIYLPFAVWLLWPPRRCPTDSAAGGWRRR